jgi:membrane-associated phospholipid phosphatase
MGRPRGYRSFYSGHVSLGVSALTAAAITVNRRHGVQAWPWIVTGVVGVSIAAGRVAAGLHFYSDVAVGALMGLGVGYLTTRLHALPEPVSRLSFTPVGGGALAVYSRGW